MQVFLPFADFDACARALDNRRLQKQALECLQLLLAMYDVPLDDGRPRTGHKSHPAYLAWKPYPLALIRYTLAICAECKSRGIKSDTILARVTGLIPPGSDLEHAPAPPFLGDEAMHRSHRCRLLQKGKEDAAKRRDDWYAQYGWSEADDPDLAQEGYLWPVYEDDECKRYRLERR
jgi:hypothetical protein